MDLWIINQDKNDLAKINYVFIAEEKKHYLMGYSNGIKIFLGEYKTKERLQEILNEIAKYLNKMNVIYEMPKE